MKKLNKIPELPKEYYCIDSNNLSNSNNDKPCTDYDDTKKYIAAIYDHFTTRGLRDLELLYSPLAIRRYEDHHLLNLIVKYVIEVYEMNDIVYYDIDKDEFIKIVMILLDKSGFFD